MFSDLVRCIQNCCDQWLELLLTLPKSPIQNVKPLLYPIPSLQFLLPPPALFLPKLIKGSGAAEPSPKFNVVHGDELAIPAP